MPWRSPAGQPAWARPALLAVAVVAAVGYGWGMAGASVESFYGAAARSMSESWHDFIFGAFDPAGIVTVDKGLGRLTGHWARVAGPPSPLLVAAEENGQLLTAETMSVKPGWHRLLAGPFAADDGWLLPAAVADGGWLLPAAVAGALGVLISRRSRGRCDPLRAA